MKLNAIMEFDCPVEVKDNGRVLPRHDLYAPDLLDEQISSDEWEFFSTGYTGQYGYNGPIMHNSEFIGGRLETDILSNPGIYVVVAAYWSPDETEPPYADNAESEIEGWAVLKMRESNG